METLQKHFPSIPPDILVEQVEILQKARDELVVNKYGGVITMKPASTSSSNASSLPKGMKETIDARVSLGRMDDADRWSPPRPSPERRNSHAAVRLPDLDALVITDNEHDEAIVIHKPRRTTERSPTRPSRHKGPPQELNPEPQNPTADRPENINFLSPTRAANKPQSPQRTSPIKLLANSTSVTPTSGARHTGNESRHKSVLQSPEHSPIKSVLNNKALRLKMQSNLERISGFESPKHGRLKFEKQPPIKSPSPPRSRTNIDKEIEAATSFVAIDNYFQNSSRRLKDNKNEDENQKRSSRNTPRS
ncbi:uncharacterized protein DFL_006597 [Arthrobotrys flagrans]|uniref:Uncharacterized protein n=1 Tax=Arthrobotrys flagrans TaxID=97331 RepID=A0A436ZTU2_ARTFL|nr:hypothetical protein DFL_006597 [Arthrobotrys flagrans]